MSAPLEGSKLKIERAEAHLKELVTLIKRFFEIDSNAFFKEVDPGGEQDSLTIKWNPEPPGEIAVVAGEILYALRSALDHLACALATHHGAARPTDTYFPFGRNKEHFESASVQEKVKRLSPEATDMIHALKPYKGGNDLLWLLHSLNLVDKHQALICIAGVSVRAKKGFTIKPSGIGLQTVHLPKWHTLDKEINSISLPPGAEGKDDIELSYGIAFRNIDLVEGQPIEAVLHQMIDLAKRIIGIFEDRFFKP